MTSSGCQSQQTRQAAFTKIADLQILRGVAITLVLLSHLSLPQTLLGAMPVKITDPFFLGVEIFFVLSGYVVTKTLLKDEFNPVRFVIRRVFRLYPAILAFFVISYCVDVVLRNAPIPAGGTRDVMMFPQGEFVAQAISILTGGFILRPVPAAYSNGAMWSLSVEFQFYAAITALCIYGRLLHLTRSQMYAVLVFCSGVVFLLCLAMRLAAFLGYVNSAAMPYWLVYCVSWRFDFLMAGVLVTAVDQWLTTPNRWLSTDWTLHLSPWLLFIPLAIMACCESPNNPVEAKPYAIGFGHPVAALCFSMLILIAGRESAFPRERGTVYRGLEWLGDRSYAIYLLHFPVFILAWLCIFMFSPSTFNSAKAFGVSQCVLATAIGLPLAALVYRYVELPSIALGKAICRQTARRVTSGHARQ